MTVMLGLAVVVVVCEYVTECAPRSDTQSRNVPWSVEPGTGSLRYQSLKRASHRQKYVRAMRTTHIHTNMAGMASMFMSVIFGKQFWGEHSVKEIAGRAAHKAIDGAMWGAGLGVCLGAATSVANSVLYTADPAVTYLYKGKQYTFRGMTPIKDLQLEQDVRTMSKYQDRAPAVYNKACRLLQHLVDIYSAFQIERAAGKDAVKLIAAFKQTAIRVDTYWRSFYYAVKDSRDAVGHEDTKKSAFNIHFSAVELLHSMRKEFEMNSQLQI